MAHLAKAPPDGPLGAYRNLTSEFIRRRDASRAHTRPFHLDDKQKSSDTSKLLAVALDGASGPGGMDLSQFGAHGVASSVAPDWVVVSNEIQDYMQKIQSRLTELSQYHSKAVLPNFDEFSGEEQQVEMLTKEITKMFKRCENNIKILQGFHTSDDNDRKVRQNLVRNFAAQLQKQSMDFRKRQKDYLSKLKSVQDRGPGGDVLGEVFETNDDDYDPGFNDIQIQRTAQIVDDTLERDQEVVKIIESVNELAQIMKDLAVLVIDQGTILDRIDYNIQQVAASVEDGVEQIKKADEHQKQSKIFVIITCLAASIILMIIIVIAKKAIMG